MSLDIEAIKAKLDDPHVSDDDGDIESTVWELIAEVEFLRSCVEAHAELARKATQEGPQRYLREVLLLRQSLHDLRNAANRSTFALAEARMDLATLSAACETAIEDSIRRPMGVVPASAEAALKMIRGRKPEAELGIVPGERNWTEDASHENGDYVNTCCMCDLPFMGHKRRVVCRKCAKPEAEPEITWTGHGSSPLAGRRAITIPAFKGWGWMVLRPISDVEAEQDANSGGTVYPTEADAKLAAETELRRLAKIADPIAESVKLIDSGE